MNLTRPEKFYVYLILLLGLNNFVLAYELPCFPPFLSSSRAYSFANSPVSLFLSQERAAFALEIGAGKYIGHLFSWPGIQGYWHFVYKNLGGSVGLINTYQYTTRDDVYFINPEGKYWGKGCFWITQFIYTFRNGLSYQLFPIFVLGLSGDINFGFKRFDSYPPSGLNDWIPDKPRHEQSSDLSFSFTLGGAIISRTKYKIIEVLYQSEVKTYLNENVFFQRAWYVIPAQFSVSWNYPVGAIDAGVKYCHRWGEYRDCYDSLQIIKTNDLMFDFLIPVNGDTKFYIGCYTFPLSYKSSSKGFGVGIGPKLPKTNFLIFYETSETQDWGTQGVWRWLIRYGMRLEFAI